MPAYSFKQHFKTAIINGKKRQTIRKPRKRQTVVGDTLQLYTGMRTKNCQKLREAECLAVIPITIGSSFVTLDGVELTVDKIEHLANLDGFATRKAFFDFFEQNHGLPFEGVVIEW